MDEEVPEARQREGCLQSTHILYMSLQSKDYNIYCDLNMNLKDKFHDIFNRLDEKLFQENEGRRQSGALLISPVKIMVLGQTALLLADLPFPVAGTMDLDARINGDTLARKMLSEILLPEGLYLESDDHLIWVPKEANYEEWHKGNLLAVFVAEAVAVIASKAKFKRAKDKGIVRMYLQHFPDSEQRLQEWGVSAKWVYS